MHVFGFCAKIATVAVAAVAVSTTALVNANESEPAPSASALQQFSVWQRVGKSLFHKSADLEVVAAADRTALYQYSQAPGDDGASNRDRVDKVLHNASAHGLPHPPPSRGDRFTLMLVNDDTNSIAGFASVPLCILRSKAPLNLVLQLDGATDNVKHVALSVDNPAEAASNCAEGSDDVASKVSADDIAKSVKLSDKITLTRPAAGPGPVLVKPKIVERNAETGEPEEEKSFFQKYWHVIVPVVVLFFLTGLGPEEEGQAGAGGGGARAGKSSKRSR
ncbi:hypothetical protein GQ42DRAFT_158106 [Ramicandelaber brevisporus]|nr:hypothetical protein GQ42DRAFT_158106 [Ramicandelaber brevisporus]